MKGISPIIATILLIVMTVAIAGLMYAWLSGMFSSLTTSTSQQVNQVTQTVIFTVSHIYITNGSIYAVIYNGGTVPINTNNLSITAQEFWSSNDTYDGTTYTCSASSAIITSNQQNTITLSCSPNTLTTNWDSGLYYYQFTFIYDGVAVQSVLPPP